jgi:predicted nucleic acid-binding Zn ribbon protein
MATYIYETTDPSKPVQQYEIQQSMKDAPLTAHPETGEAIRRVITGGFGYIGSGSASAQSEAPRPRSGGCGSGCGCH